MEKMSKKEAVKEFENLLEKKPESVTCNIETIIDEGDAVICRLNYPYQKEGMGERTTAVVRPIKIKDVKETKLEEID